MLIQHTVTTYDIPWVPEAFHAQFPVSVKSSRPSAEDVLVCGWQSSSSHTTKTSGTQQQQQQHFISPHNIQEIKIYNNSTDNDRGAGCPK